MCLGLRKHSVMCLTVVGFIVRRALVGYSSPYLAHFRFVASAFTAATSIQFRWCFVRLRLKEKQCNTCLVNHEPQFVCTWIPVQTEVEMQKVKSNYELLFMRFSFLSSSTIYNYFPNCHLSLFNPISQRSQKPNKLFTEGCCRSMLTLI